LKGEIERENRAREQMLRVSEREGERVLGLGVRINDSAFLWYHFLSSLECHKAVHCCLSFRHSTTPLQCLTQAWHKHTQTECLYDCWRL